MIFVTVGTQLPFPRLIEAMDEIAGRLYEPVIAQTYAPTTCKNMIVEPQMNGTRYSDVLARARLIVAHAGIGTIMAAREASIPLIVLPRRASLGEHRNDHQQGTARQMLGHEGITAIWSEDKLEELLDYNFEPPVSHAPPALDGLVSGLRSFISEGA